MEFRGILVFIALIAVNVEIVMPLTCHEGLLGVHLTQVHNCPGSCGTVKIDNTIALACDVDRVGSGCMRIEEIEICYCNTDFCNTGIISVPAQPPGKIQCFQGIIGQTVEIVECDGACLTTKTIGSSENTVIAACNPVGWGDLCLTINDTLACHCITDLCNDGTPAIQTPTTRTPVIHTTATQKPVTQTPATRTSATQTPGNRTPGNRTPSNQTPGNQGENGVPAVRAHTLLVCMILCFARSMFLLF